MTVAWPGALTWMTPPYEHISMLELLSAGILAIMTVGDPGAHGAAVAGMHGMGVSTPKAAAVAAATMGFAGLLHMAKGRMFTIGLLSMMFAAAGPPAMTQLVGSTTNELGAAPKLQVNIAPMQTCIPIVAATYHKSIDETALNNIGKCGKGQ
ncbi:MAG: hypothetical protein BGO92_08225 [Magnetospirillum sp. 64-120]|nr:MAG: hypothetical protein BGO92_08225 [Magnetospirillum sp. 64-120]